MKGLLEGNVLLAFESLARCQHLEFWTLDTQNIWKHQVASRCLATLLPSLFSHHHESKMILAEFVSLSTENWLLVGVYLDGLRILLSPFSFESIEGWWVRDPVTRFVLKIMGITQFCPLSKYLRQKLWDATTFTTYHHAIDDHWSIKNLHYLSYFLDVFETENQEIILVAILN